MENINLNDLLEVLNKEGKKKALETFEIQKKDWSKFMKDNYIEYDNKLKQYIIPMSKDVQALLLSEEEIEINKDKDTTTTENENKESVTIDICDFINKKEDLKVEIQEISNEQSENAEDKTKDLPITINPIDNKEEQHKNESTSVADSKNTQTDEIKSRRGRKKIEVKDGYEIYSQQLSKKLIKALNYKALTEGIDVETLVTDLLLQSVEKKYFIGMSI